MSAAAAPEARDSHPRDPFGGSFQVAVRGWGPSAAAARPAPRRARRPKRRVDGEAPAARRGAPRPRPHNLWVRRASIASLIVPMRRGLALDAACDNARELHRNPRDLIQSAGRCAKRGSRTRPASKRTCARTVPRFHGRRFGMRSDVSVPRNVANSWRPRLHVSEHTGRCSVTQTWSRAIARTRT